MPCDATPTTPTQREVARNALAAQLRAGTARVRINPATRRPEIVNWQGDRAGLCDGCALSSLTRHPDMIVRAKVGAVLLDAARGKVTA